MLAFVSGMDDKAALKLYGAGIGVAKRKKGSLSATATSALAAKPRPCLATNAAARTAAFMAAGCRHRQIYQNAARVQENLFRFQLKLLRNFALPSPVQSRICYIHAA